MLGIFREQCIEDLARRCGVGCEKIRPARPKLCRTLLACQHRRVPSDTAEEIERIGFSIAQGVRCFGGVDALLLQSCDDFLAALRVSPSVPEGCDIWK